MSAPSSLNKLPNVPLLLILVSATLILSVVSGTERGGRRVVAQRGDDSMYANFKSPCGNANEVSKRIGPCMSEIFAILEGRIPNPRNDADILPLCQRFEDTAKCARVNAKECLGGLHKTAVGAVASATRRFKQQECKNEQSRGKYMEALKCTIRRAKPMSELMRNTTGAMQAIRDLDIAPEQKLMKMCCMLTHLDREIENVFNADCPKETHWVLSIVHAMTDDARSTLCVAPKCKGALDKVLNSKYQPSQNLIEPIMQILFQLSVN